MNPGEWSWLKILVISLLVLQLVSVVLVWSLNPLGQPSQTVFALLLSANLVAFATNSYLNRTWNSGGLVRTWLLALGSVLVLFFMFAVLFA